MSSEWVGEATGRPSTELNAAYGYLWWLNRRGVIAGPLAATSLEAAANPTTARGRMVPGAPEDMYWALGLGNQVIQVDPGSRTVVVRLGTASRCHNRRRSARPKRAGRSPRRPSPRDPDGERHRRCERGAGRAGGFRAVWRPPGERLKALAEPPDSLGVTEPSSSAVEAVERACRALLAQHPDAPVAAVDELGLFAEMPASVEVVGHSFVTGRSGLDVVVPADRVVVISAWDRARNAGASRVPVRLASQPDQEVMLHFFDLRPRHGVFLAVLISEGLTDVLVDANSDAALRPRLFRQRKSELAVFIDVEGPVAEILGWEPHEMIGRGSLDLIHPDDQERAIAHWMEMLSSPESIHRVRLRHRHASGSWVWLELTNTNLLDDPDHACIETEAVDISDEMAAQEAVRARERLLHRLAETMPLGLLQVDADGRVIYSNERLGQIVGREPEPTIDAQLSNVVPEDRDSLQTVLALALRDGEDSDVEVRLRTPGSGEERRVHVRVGALADEADNIVGAVVCVDDVTERARLYAQLERRAEFDMLTDCRSRAAILEALAGAMDKGPVGVIFIDLDGFKTVNDEHGHAAGDALLSIVAERLRRSVRTHDLVGRLGGDEFLVVCEATDDVVPELLSAAERVADAVSRPVVLGDLRIALQASVGVAMSYDGRSAEGLVADADRAMYESKRLGAGRPVLCTSELRACWHADRTEA